MTISFHMIGVWVQVNKNARGDKDQMSIQSILVHFSSQPLLQSLERGLHMISVIATILETEH